MTDHASSSAPPSLPQPTLAERARTLVAIERMGTLATASKRHDGWPFGSLMPYAADGEGCPILLISNMAVHTQNVLADPRASMMIAQSGAENDPLGAARVTLVGRVNRLDGPASELRDHYLARHPNARHWIGFSDFGFFMLDVTDVYFIGGFGVMGWVSVEDYRHAEPDPLWQDAPGIIEHMNADHGDALRWIVKSESDLDATDAKMVACDRLGFTVRAQTEQGVKGIRINFPEEVRSREDARRVLVTMTRAARGEAARK